MLVTLKKILRVALQPAGYHVILHNLSKREKKTFEDSTANGLTHFTFFILADCLLSF